ncbi:hypothetical protein FB451DRAFT_1118283 [Mycena latifolia]|nr:hypothetical protein FB451DRAFT_1118283 [Mycena latifolia]
MSRAVVPKAALTTFLKNKLHQGTTRPWTTNFNHMRRVPRKLRMTSRKTDAFDPNAEDGFSVPKTRIKFWNIVPGDQVRIRGRYGNKLREVFKIRRLENIVEFPQTQRSAADGNTSGPAYSYASCQLFIGEYEFPPLPGSTEPRKLPVFAERLSTTPPVWNTRLHRWQWDRFATRTTPVVPHLKGEKIKIPWPTPPPRSYRAGGMYDTTKKEVAKVTYVPPSFSHILTAPAPRVPTEDEYIAGMSHPTQKPWFGDSPPVEIYLHKELSNPHSRAKKMKRWQSHQSYKKSLLRDYLAAEMRELNGRTTKEARAEATFKWRQKLSAEEEAERRRRWLTLAVAEKAKKKQARKTRKAIKRKDQLTQLGLWEAPNQVIPKDVNI